MDGQTVRTALGTIQSNPSAEDAWQILSVALTQAGGDLEPSAVLALLQAARERHGSRGEYDAVARLLEYSVRLAAGTFEEPLLLNELATVFLEDLFSGRLAIETLERAIARSEGDADYVSKLERLNKRAGAQQEQAATYLKEAENAPDDDYRSAMLMRASEVEICFSEKPAYAKVIENLELSLRLNSANLPATRLLEVIYRRQADFDGVLRVLERAADRAPDHQARVAAGIRLARLYQHHFEDQEKAAAAFDRVLETDPSQSDAMAFVTEYYSQTKRWGELVRVYERPLKGAAAGDESTLGDMLQVAMLHWKMRGAPADAEPWFARIQAIKPAHDGVLNFYREYKASLSDDAGLVQILREAQQSLLPGDERIAELETEIASKQDAQASAQKQIEKFKSLLRENPDDLAARAELTLLYKQTQGHNALVELLRQQLERLPEDDATSRLAVMREIATVYRQYLKSETALVGVLNQIVHLDGKLDEKDIGEVRELVSLYEKLSRPRDLLSSLKLLAEIVPDRAEKISIYRQVGRKWLEQFSNIQHAMEAFAALHELDPKDSEAVERLEDLYRKRRAWKELFDLYEEQLKATGGEARVPLLREMAQLAAERLSRVEDSLIYYQEILDLDPTRIEVLDRIEKQAERAKNWEVLADTLERRLAQMPEDETRLPVLQKLGGVYAEQLDKPEEAIGTWRRVVEVQPGHPRAMRVLRDTYLKALRFDELESLYKSQNDLEGLAEVLSTAADRHKEPEERLSLSYRAARVYEEGLGQASRAIRSYERILSIDPRDARAILRLLPLYEEGEKWARIPALLEVLVDVSGDEGTRIAYFERLVDLAGSKLADKKGAFGYARRAFEGAPQNQRALELLDSSARAAGAWEEMVETLESRLQNLGSLPPAAPIPIAADATVTEPKSRGKKGKKGKKGPSEPPVAVEPQRRTSSIPVVHNESQRAIALRLARVLGEELGRVQDAVLRLKSLAARSPTDPEVMSALDSLLRRESRPDDLRWLFNHRQTHAATDQLRAELLCEWAIYEELTLDDGAEALKRYDAALLANPTKVEALEAVVRLAVGQNQPERAAQVLVLHRDLLTGPEAAHKDAMLADLLASRLKRPTDALAAAKRALEGGAEPGVVIPVLKRLVEVAEVRGEAARLLSEQYEAGGDSRQEADAVRALISETSDELERVELYKKLADIYEEKLSEPGAALSVILEALGRHTTELALWDRASPLAGAAGRPTDLADAYRSALRAKIADDLALELSRRAAELHESVLLDPQGAVPYYEKILSLEPDDEQAFSRLKEVLTAGERWRELEELYDAEIQRLDDGARQVEMLAEVALLAEDIMGDAERAIGYHVRILAIDPQTSFALESLDRLFTRLERRAELIKILAQRAEHSVGEEQQKLLVRLAQNAVVLHMPDQAMSAVETVLLDDQSNYEARDIAEAMLLIGSVRLRAAIALEAVYESKDEIRDLVRVLGVRVEALRPSETEIAAGNAQIREDERRDILRRIATLRDDRLHDDEGSFDVFAELSPLDPADSDLRERLIDSGRRLGRNAKVVAVLMLGAEAAQESSLRAEIWLQTARVQTELQDDLEGAEHTLNLVVLLRVDEPDAALAATRSLEVLLIAAGRSVELSVNLKLQIELESDFERKGELLARLAHLSAAVLGDNAGAITAWEARLVDSPDDSEALGNLTELYEKAERFEDVARVLEQRRDATNDVKERSSLTRNLADVQERHLGDAVHAIESYQSILDQVGPTPEVLAALARLYEKSERWEELGDTYGKQADLLEDETERLSALTQLGNLRSRHLADVSGALDAYRRALAVDMAHGPSREALAHLLDHEDDQARLEAAEILRPIYEVDGAHERLLKVLEVQATATDDETFRADCYQSAMQVAEDSLKDGSRAMSFALKGTRAAVSQGDISSWLAAMERLSVQADARKAHVELLAEIVSEIFDPETQLNVQRRVGELLRKELGDRPGAVSAYRKALEIQADDERSLVALEEIHEAAAEWELLLSVMEQRSEATSDEQTRRELAFRKAELLAGNLANPHGAIDAYEQILSSGLDRKAVAELTALYVSSERFSDLNALLARRIDEADGDVAELRVDLARSYAENQGEMEQALDELALALKADAQSERAVSLLVQLQGQIVDPAQKGRAASLLEPVYMARADYDNVLGALSLRLAGSDSPDERRELVTRIAQIYEEQKEDYAAALQVTAQLLADDPADEFTLQEMERLAKVASAPVALAELLRVQAGRIVDTDESSARLCRRSGELFSANGKPELALPLLRRALAFEPDNAELFRAVDELLQSLGTPQERVELYRGALEHRYDPEDQKQLLLVIANLEEVTLGNVDAAIAAHQRAVETDDTNATSLDALTRLYRQTADWTSLIALYLRRAESSGPAEGAQYRIALADLYMRQLGDHQSSLDQLEEVVRDVPDCTEAIARLEAMRQSDELRARVVELLRPIYEANDDWRRIILLNEDRFFLAQDQVEQVAVLRETAELNEVRGGDLVKARRLLARALKLQPDDDDVRAELERVCAITNEWSALAELYEEITAENSEFASRHDVVRRLAELFDTKLDDPRSALARFKELHASEPSEVETVEALLRLSLLLGDWTTREAALLVRAESVFDEAERAELLSALGHLREFTLGDDAGAIVAYERSFEANGQSAKVCDRLIVLYEAKGEAGRLVDLYLARVEGGQANDDLQFALLLKAASLLERSLGEPQRAIECLGQALSARPGDAATILELNRLYRSEEMWSDLLDNLRLEAGTAETGEKRLEVRHEIASVLAQKMEFVVEAMEAYGVILDERPDDEVAVDALFSLVEREEHLARQAAEILVQALRQTSLRSRLVQALTLSLTDEQAPAERVETLRTIAEVQERDLKQPLLAFEALLKAFAGAPQDAALLRELERVSSEVEGWARFAEVLNQLASESFEPELGSALWVQLAQIYEVKLGKKDRAIVAYQAAAEQVGDRLDLLDALDRLFSDVGDTDAVVELLERRMALVDTDEDHARLLVRQGQLQLDKQNDPRSALATFRAAVERHLHNTAATAQLSRLLETPELFEEVFGILDGVYRDRAAGSDLASLHELRVKRAGTARERLEMRRGLAQVLEEECKDVAAAQRVLLEGLTDDLEDEGLRDEIERLLPMTGAWSDAAAALLLAATTSKEVEPRTGKELCERAAAWLRDKAGDAAGAEQALLSALKFDQENDDLLEQLEALQRGEGAEARLLQTLRARAHVAADEGTKVEFLRRCQALAEGLSNHVVAEAVLREILVSDPEDTLALEALTHIRQAAGDNKEAYSLLARRIVLESDPDRLRVLKLDSATIASEKLGLLDDAIALFVELLEQAPGDVTTAAALRSAYQKAGKFKELGALISTLMATATSAVEQANLKVSLAGLHKEQFGDDEKAIALLEEVLAVEPGHEDAGATLSTIYEETSRHRELTSLLLRRAEADAQAGRMDVASLHRRRAAQLLEGSLKDFDGAISVWLKIRENDDTMEVLEAIFRLEAAASRQARAAAVLEEICAGLEGDEQVRRRGELASLYRGLGDADALIRTVEGTLALRPTDVSLRALVRREYETAGAWQQLADMTVADADQAQGTPARVELLRAAATIHLKKRGDAQTGAVILAQAAELAPDDRQLLLELCDAYSASGRGMDAVGVLEKIVLSYAGKRAKELGEIHRRLATAYLSQNDHERALAELEKAFRIEPGNIHILTQLGDTAIETGDMKKAQQMFRALLLQKLDDGGPITKAEVFCRLGLIHQKLDEGPKAKQMYERALQTDSTLQAAKDGLAGL